MEESLLENQIGDAVGDLTPTMRADLDEAGITSIADLTYMEGDRRRWRTFSSAWPYITAYTQVSAPPQGPRRLKVGQVWQCVTRKGGQWLGADRLKEIVAILPGGDLRYRLWTVEPGTPMVPLQSKAKIRLTHSSEPDQLYRGSVEGIFRGDSFTVTHLGPLYRK